MGKVLVNEESLSAIGDAIREKKGEDANAYYSYGVINQDNYDFINANDRCYYLNIPEDFVCPEEGFIIIPRSSDLSVGTRFNLYFGIESRSADIGYFNNMNYLKDGEDAVISKSLFEKYIGNPNYEQRWFLGVARNDDGDFSIDLSTHIPVGKNPDTHYKPSEMADEIKGLKVINGIFYNKIDGSYMFAYNAWNWVLRDYADKFVDTKVKVTNMYYMFYNSTELTEIPITISLLQSNNSANSMFASCQQLEHLPYIIANSIFSVGIDNINSIFTGCNNLKEIPEDWVEKAKITNVTQCGGAFSGCRTLRKIPQSFIDIMTSSSTTTSATYSPYKGTYTDCIILEELTNLPVVNNKTITTNYFANSFDYCNRLKHLTFKTNTNGTAIIANWKSQTIDLSKEVGYTQSASAIIGGANNIVPVLTSETRITNAATYAQYKDDPDAWTSDMTYSRYNHDSAVETINSLPNTTSSGGTNTIKFKGAAGSATDGGAINTLTADEIAVAATKGWTVTFA